MARKNSWRNSGEMTCARAVPGKGFKRCCLKSGHYDGSKRDYFFPRVAKRLASKAKAKTSCRGSVSDHRINREFACCAASA